MTDVIVHKTGEYPSNNYPRASGSLADAMDWETKARLEALKSQLKNKTKTKP